jgi:hypothetical protein
MKTRVAIVAALLTVTLAACTVNRFPGDCAAAPSTTIRTKNRALVHNSAITTTVEGTPAC